MPAEGENGVRLVFPVPKFLAGMAQAQSPEPPVEAGAHIGLGTAPSVTLQQRHVPFEGHPETHPLLLGAGEREEENLHIHLLAGGESPEQGCLILDRMAGNDQ